MKYINTKWDIPYYNMAFEEYVMTQLPEDDYVFFYIHKPSIIVGKHQNVIEEINKEYVDKNNIIISRRLSGGGAVYHDWGNLNYSFVSNGNKKVINNFKKFIEPIIKALDKLGIKAELTDRNDIVIDGKKVSGNAQYFKKNKLLHHGTLLFDSKLNDLNNALKVKELKIKSKGIKSVRSNVTNIKDYLKEEISMLQFKKKIMESIFENNSITEYNFSNNDLNNVEDLVRRKFGTWEWNWGESPEFNINKIHNEVEMHLNVKDGIMKNLRIYKNDSRIIEFEDLLIGQQYRKEKIKSILYNININDYLYEINEKEFIDLIFEQ